jgi:hypothetical protein
MTAAEITAFLIIECGVSYDIKDFQDLSLGDPLITAMFEAWRCKQDREMERSALICAVMANAMGGNSTTPADFFTPMSEKTLEQRRKAKEGSLLGLFVRHNASLER